MLRREGRSESRQTGRQDKAKQGMVQQSRAEHSTAKRKGAESTSRLDRLVALRTDSLSKVCGQ
jgi:hypothetical protein